MTGRVSKTVLVVEDDVLLRRGICGEIDSLGYRAMGARDGEDALAFLRALQLPPALILLDLGMANMDGTEFASQIAKDSTLKGIPIVLMSARADLDSVASRLGVAGSLKKPIRPEQLLEELRKHCGPERAPRRTP